MSIPKEPRQLMINIMYLVLTALLALNVSAEVLKAFDRVDRGMKNSNEVVDDSNQFTQAQIVKAAQEDERAKALVTMAAEARQLSSEFTEYIEGIKTRLIQESGGWVEKDGEKVKLKGAKDVETTTQILVEGGLGDSIQATIESYYNEFVNLIDDPDDRVAVASGITLGKGVIDFEPSRAHPNYDWKTETFRKVPVAAIMPILTSFESDAKNAEATILEYLKSQIGITDYKFDNLQAKVLAETKYLISGKEYKADIFLAATSSQTVPQVYLGSFTSDVTKVSEDGGYEVIKGKQADEIPLNNPSPLEVDEATGVAEYKVTATGSRKLYGVIQVKQPNSDDLYDFYPFEMEYETFNPGDVVISPTAMNVLYIGVDNPVEISAGNAEPSTVRASGCGIQSAGSLGKYIARPSKPGREIISVSGSSKEGDPVRGQMEFRIMRIPDPYAFCGISKGPTIKSAALKAQTGLIAKNDDFVFNLRYNVIGFEMIYAPQRGSVFSTVTKGNKFNEEMKSVLNRVKPGDTVIFNNIRVKMPDKTTRNLSVTMKVI